jgi:hypothetical protein
MYKKRLVLGAKHPVTLESLNDLAGLYCGQGNYKEALPVLVECFQTTKAVLGTDHSITQHCGINLVGCLIKGRGL